MNQPRVGRNDPCPCGSGKKYKQCCMAADQSRAQDAAAPQRKQAEIPVLLKSAQKLRETGQPREAERIYQEILILNPKHPEALLQCGLTLMELGEFRAALAPLGKLVQAHPSALAHATKANALQALGQLRDAEDNLRQAITLYPGMAEAHNNLGNALAAQGRFEEAVTCFREALRLDPRSLGIHNNIGNALQELSRPVEAIEAYRKAIAGNPDSAVAWNNLGNALMQQCDFEEAHACYLRALALRPDMVSAYDNLLFGACFDLKIPPEQYLAFARQYAERVTRHVVPFDHPSDSADTSPARPLRVGMVSGDFKNHPVAYFLENVLKSLDSGMIDIHAFATRAYEDAMTARLKPLFSGWHSLVGLTDQRAASLIRDAHIDILIDLSGHTAFNRLPIFAWKPAPVQVSWLGYLASTGLPQMDYYLTDPVSNPPAYQSHFSERLWYLADTNNCFTAPEATPRLEITPPPLLKTGHVTFGTFQRTSKISDRVLALWARILLETPGAIFRLPFRHIGNDMMLGQLQQRLENAGIPLDRVRIVGPVPDREEYLATHADVDIVLDTTPYQGITTTCEALWMGVPTITLAGDRMLARQGAALLSAIGLQDWVASTEDEYVRKAVNFASQPELLARLRSTLRARLVASPLMDAPRFARNLEKALTGMWEHYCRSAKDKCDSPPASTAT